MPVTAAQDALKSALAAALPNGTRRIGVAVSGGGDSMALMALLSEWAAPRDVHVIAASIDHGLRRNAAQEAALAARHAAGLGIAHTVLNWHWDGQGNLQAKAREGRRDLLRDWARANGVVHVCLGHTRDDQAETVLLRLARGSGVDGLSAMRPVVHDRSGVTWLRPLLQVPRAALRDELRDRRIDWAEDPGNDDPRFGRVAARRLLAQTPLPGLGTDRLADTAERMAAARSVLGRVAFEAAQRVAQVTHGAVRLDLPDYADLPDDTRWRILSAALCRVGGHDLRPRFATLRAAEAEALAGRRATLHGALLRPAGGGLWVHREPAAITNLRSPAPGPWDGRWDVQPERQDAAQGTGVDLAPLGVCGLRARPDWRRAAIPRVSLLSTPAIWRGDDLVAAPVLDPALGVPCPWHARPLWDTLALCADLLSD